MARLKVEQPKRLAQKLKEIRLRLNLSQDEMYTALIKEVKTGVKLHEGYISLYETGKRTPSLLVVLAYSKVASKIAGVSMETLIDDDLELNS